MPGAVTIRFHRGTLELDGPGVADMPGVLWDERSRTHRALGLRFADILASAEAAGGAVDGDLRPSWSRGVRSSEALGLRYYQRRAITSWTAFDRRGIVVLPTGAGKTRLAIAAVLETGLSAAILCPTRALAAQWITELEAWLGTPIGLVGDGQRRVEPVTVMTFESAYRHLDTLGATFGLLIVDEVHHFGSGARAEALEASPAIARLGLTATAPPPESQATGQLERLVGPVVFEMGYEELVGTHLSEMTMERIIVRLDETERREYDVKVARFRELRRALWRAHRDADYATLMRAVASAPGGRKILREHAEATELAAFPGAKRRLVSQLLARHAPDRTIVFTAFAENAYQVAVDNLVPVIAAETSTRERKDILEGFRCGRFRAIASARVLNEGIDVPDANVAILVAGTLGAREYVQRIGRVLRSAEGKHARIYELVTVGTSEETRASGRRSHVA
jgi:superfamily II DNA or RNA helicase